MINPSSSIAAINMESDPVYLSYGDSVLRMSDLDILQSNQWLNDRIIGFYCEYCQLDKFRDKGICFGRRLTHITTGTKDSSSAY